MAGIGSPPYPSLARSLWDEWAEAARRGFSNLGTYNSASRLPSGEPSDHAVYPALAFDAGFEPATGWENRRARAYFNWLTGRPGIEYVILGNKIWSRTRGLHSYQHGGHDDHVHASGNRTGAGGGPDVGQTLGELWREAGGRPALTNIMTAIALAESGGRRDAIGGPNPDGTYDRGLWQINDVHGFNRNRLISDPLYNAQAAVRIQESQGLEAWTVYRTGAYRTFMGNPGPPVYGGGSGQPPRRRPGGGTDPDDDAAEAQTIAWQDYLDPPGPLGPPWDPLGILRGAGDSVGSAVSFFKWIAWIFHPRNILRIVEFLTGAGLMALGLATSVRMFDGGEDTGRKVEAVAELTPPGRMLKTRQYARSGRKQARAQARRKELSDTRKAAAKSERAKIAQRKNKKSKLGPGETIPF